MNKLIPVLLTVCLVSCQGGGRPGRADGENPATVLLEQAAGDVGGQRFDDAMEKALQALDLSAGDPYLQVRSLSTIVGIDIMASRDADAWEKALQAEEIARVQGYRKELADILISKAKLCSYAEISPETGRNDEGLDYATEALSIAEETGAVEQEAEACFVIGSLYINKNRWSDPIDPDIYDTAGEYLDRGQALADTHDIPRLRRNGILFRSRWFQQGDRNDEAIRYFEQALAGLPENDYLTASALDDRLVRLYSRTDDAQKMLQTHDDYVFRMQKYIQQKQDETLQEMETRFQVQEKERALERERYRISLLILILVAAGLALVLILDRLQKVRRRNAELQRLSDSKEQIIELLSRDLKNPANAISGEISKLAADASALPAEAIREKCRALASEAETINTDVANYVEEILIKRSRRIADIGLSQRELQIIRLSAEGLKAAEIAERTFLSVHTVNTHRQRIYAKMDVKNVSEMLHKASELGIV